jgi:hypothetical protein
MRGRHRYALCPGPAPTSRRVSPRGSNQEPSCRERIRAMTSRTLSDAAAEAVLFRPPNGYANNGILFSGSNPRAYSR